MSTRVDIDSACGHKPQQPRSPLPSPRRVRQGGTALQALTASGLRGLARSSCPLTIRKSGPKRASDATPGAWKWQPPNPQADSAVQQAMPGSQPRLISRRCSDTPPFFVGNRGSVLVPHRPFLDRLCAEQHRFTTLQAAHQGRHPRSSYSSPCRLDQAAPMLRAAERTPRHPPGQSP